MSRLHRDDFNQVHRTEATRYDDRDVENFNRDYDLKPNPQPGHELGIPGFARLRAELSDDELADAIWRWHMLDFGDAPRAG